MPRLTVALVALTATTGCGDGQDGRSASDGRLRVEAAQVAERYYDAFRARRFDDACAMVATRLLASRRIVGLNIAEAEQLDRLDVPAQERSGCAAVRQRRKAWTEPVPRSEWRVDDILLDRSGTRARVDTSAEGSYWMRRIDGRWRIVGFGALTDQAVRELGGQWDRDPLR